jgi:hypothetical protein
MALLLLGLSRLNGPTHAGPPEFSLYYPDAVILADQEQRDIRTDPNYPCNQPSLKIMKTRDSADAVFSWYRDRLTKLGWKFGDQDQGDSLVGLTRQWYSRDGTDAFQVQIDDPQRLPERGINVQDGEWTVFEVLYYVSARPCPGGLAT